ncbi:Kelch repeat-containing protein (plasmid) [Catenovulum sp. SX2]|uniref:Kelch repeat-containing protein n=1 Tax=Catenovulum sp. SX2 TaxID=3398614 RepID=UPI003F8685B0
MSKFTLLGCMLAAFLLLSACVKQNIQSSQASWQNIQTIGTPHPRHEATFIELNGKFYALGGRRIQPVSIYDPANNSWTEGAKPPFQIHHFQAAVYNNKIVIAGAMTGGYPNETAVANIMFYDPKLDEWQQGPEIPADRRRGGAGVVIKNHTLYLLAGIQNGHVNGWVNWADSYNFKTNKWQKLADAPRARDHFQAAEADNKIYLAGGRTTSQITKQVFSLTIAEVDVFDLTTHSWSTLKQKLPTPRAGNATFNLNGHIAVLGGETDRPTPAHAEVEVYNPQTKTWYKLPNLNQGRHGTGVVYYNDALWTCCGSGARGGKPELLTTEKLVIED